MRSLLLVILVACVLADAPGDEEDFGELEFQLHEHFAKGLKSPVPWRWARKMPRSSSSWTSMYLPSAVSNTTSDACKKDLQLMALDLQDPEIQWPIKMVDSWGKFPDGMMWGNFITQGSFSQCLDIKHNTEEVSIKGKYCSVMYGRWSSKRAKSQLMPDDVMSSLRMPFASAVASLNTFVLIIYGTCMPNHCTYDDLKASIADTIETGLLFLNLNCHTDEDHHVYDAADISFITILALLLALMLSAAAIDVYIDIADKQDWRKGSLKYLLVFSLTTNFRKLFHVSEESASGTISCLHGIRVLSMCWVVYGHQYVMNIFLNVNLFALEEKTNGLFFQIFGNGHVSVDTFFFMSGLLVSYGVMRELQRTGRLDVIKFYVHRLLRLTPPIALVVGFNATIVRFFARGPLYSDSLETVKLCRENGWKDIVYVNNFLGFNENNDWLDCVGQCWYTAVDTQLFLIAPLLLLPLHFYPGIGQGLLYAFSLASVLTPAIITVVGDYAPAPIMGLPAEVTNRYLRYIYVTPWCRAGSWTVGLWTGYIIFKQNQKKLTLAPWQVVSGWTLAVFVSLAVLFGEYGYIGFNERLDYDVMTQFFFGGFHKAAWAMAVAWVVIACHNGYGGVVNAFLSYPAWQPLSRLTYSMFLMSIPIQILLCYTEKSLFYFNHLNKILEACGTLFVTGIAATLLTLAIESPIIGLEKIIFGKLGVFTKKKSPDGFHYHSRL
ncbi:nose resistant to fluoxetine protein 6-like [Oratosquilla oratoria]|uniref:nose resistant to fluoxetine protein 6-like n=1 Tax=Oratosquilla oratoria TaxID=337810 RepID=UPI003F7659B9